MSDEHAMDRDGRRGRVVMLSDGEVEGDSRTQKAARSAAAAGWDVVLLARAPGRRSVNSRLGGAEVRLIPRSAPLGRRSDFRRAPLRNPLAYPPGPHAAFRKQRVKAWRVDLYHHHLALGLAAAQRRSPVSRAFVRLGQAGLFGLRAYVRGLGKWVALRARQTDALMRKRKAMDSPLNRLVTWFWRKAKGDRCWRRLDPQLWEAELAYGKAVDGLRPDLIHASDFRMLGVGARAAQRARARGRNVKLVWDVREFRSGIEPHDGHPRRHPARCAYEREYASSADAVVTVSETLADLLVDEFGLPERPVTVLDAPEAAWSDARPTADLRTHCDVDPDVPLVVYSGPATEERGVDIVIEALPRLGGVHVAFAVPDPATPYLLGLVDRAAELGVGDRVHLVPAVPYDQMARFLAGADAAVVPNYEIGPHPEFFTYSHARLPLVVGDAKDVAEVTRSTGQGKVFPAGDLDGYTRAVRAVLAEPEQYRAAYDTPGLLEQWTWETQAEILDRVYRRLRPDLPTEPAPEPGIDGASTDTPDVSVIVAVYDSMPYLYACLTSLAEQTIGTHRMEIIAVDDGSTDGSGKELDRFAEKYPYAVKVIHQANTGGPAAPYNRALEVATGRYVYFVGADDYLGTEALERLVTAADKYGSDVVAGKVVGVNGRRIHQALYTANNPDISLYDSALPWALNNCKLFRRDLIERHEVRYPEDMPVGSDQQFTFEACLHAKRISVLADYEYCYAVRREDDGNITYRTSSIGRLDCARKLIEFKAARTKRGPQRDKILRVHFSWELASLLQKEFLDLDRGTQEYVCAGISRLAARYLTPAIRDGLDTSRRTRISLAHRRKVDVLCAIIRDEAAGIVPPIVLENDGAFARYPGFRDKRAAVRDDHYRITGDLASRIARGVETSAVHWVRDGDGRPALSVTARAALVGSGALDPGAVRVALVPMAAGTRAPGARRTAHRRVRRLARRLGLGRARRRAYRLARRLVVGRARRIAWSLAHGRVRRAGLLIPATQVTREPALDGAGTDIRARIPMGSLIAAHRAGSRRLTVQLCVTVAGATYRVPLAAAGSIAEVRQWRRGRLYRFRSTAGQDGRLVVAVAPIQASRGTRWRLRRPVRSGGGWS